MIAFIIQGPVVIVSTEGGVNIEDTAASNPEAIGYFPIDITKGITEEQTRQIVAKLGFDATNARAIAQVLCNLYQLFITKDALLLEINPFVEDICGDCELSCGIKLLSFFFMFLFFQNIRNFH